MVVYAGFRVNPGGLQRPHRAVSASSARGPWSLVRPLPACPAGGSGTAWGLGVGLGAECVRLCLKHSLDVIPGPHTPSGRFRCLVGDASALGGTLVPWGLCRVRSQLQARPPLSLCVLVSGLRPRVLRLLPLPPGGWLDACVSVCACLCACVRVCVAASSPHPRVW